MSEKNIIGFSLSGDLSQEELNKKLDSLVKSYDTTVELRQKELEDKLNQLVLEFQKKENMVVLIDYLPKEWNKSPIKVRLFSDSERDLSV